MQASGSGQPGPEEVERELRRTLYRFDCPDAHTLGEYHLDLLEEQDRVQVAGHAAECDECRTELQTLRSFLASPIGAPESMVDRARRVVATLFVPAPGRAHAALRGAADSATRVFEAGDVTVTVGPGQVRGSLFGLVVAVADRPESLDGRVVRLVPREGLPLAATLDDLGNFEVVGLEPGLYALEIDLPDGIVVVEELRVD